MSYSVSGTATSATDFTALAGTVTIAANSTTADVSIVALKDSLEDADETVILAVATNGSHVPGSPSSATVTVIDTTLYPIAFDAWIETKLKTDADISPLDVAVDLDGDELSLDSVTQGANGSVSISGSTVTYSPDSGFHGNDEFTYTVIDPDGNEATGTITVYVSRPVALPFSVWTALNTAVTIDAAAGAFDPDGDAFTVYAVSNGPNGTVVINMDGTITYTPDTSFTGDDSFEYTVEDEDGNFSSNSITVSVADPATIVLDAEMQTEVNSQATIDILSDYAFNPSGASLTTTSVTQGSHGSVSINNDGSVIYSPASNYAGTDTFTFTVTDGNSNAVTGTVNVTIGDPASPLAPDIETGLDSLLDEIEDPEVAAEEVDAAWSAMYGDLEDFSADISSAVSATNPSTLGENLSLKDYVATVQLTYFSAHRDFRGIEQLKWILDSIGAANRSVILTLLQDLNTAKNAVPPNNALITNLTATLKLLTSVQLDLMKTRVELQTLSLELGRNLLAQWAALGKTLGHRWTLPAPELPSPLDVSIFLPKP